MSNMFDFKVKITLKGDWSKETIAKLNTAVKWWNWCEYSEFLSQIVFDDTERNVGPVSAYSDEIFFEEIVEVAVNGGESAVLEESFPLADREGFDLAIHQGLLEDMKAGKLSIVFVYKTTGSEFDDDEEYDEKDPFWEDFDEDNFMNETYILSSDGQNFVLRQK